MRENEHNMTPDSHKKTAACQSAWLSNVRLKWIVRVCLLAVRLCSYSQTVTQQRNTPQTASQAATRHTRPHVWMSRCASFTHWLSLRSRLPDVRLCLWHLLVNVCCAWLRNRHIRAQQSLLNYPGSTAYRPTRKMAVRTDREICARASRIARKTIVWLIRRYGFAIETVAQARKNFCARVAIRFASAACARIMLGIVCSVCVSDRPMRVLLSKRQACHCVCCACLTVRGVYWSGSLPSFRFLHLSPANGRGPKIWALAPAAARSKQQQECDHDCMNDQFIYAPSARVR